MLVSKMSKIEGENEPVSASELVNTSAEIIPRSSDWVTWVRCHPSFLPSFTSSGIVAGQGTPLELHTFFVTMYTNESRPQPIVTTKVLSPAHSLRINGDFTLMCLIPGRNVSKSNIARAVSCRADALVEE
jgi:hypothetical protein